jgi:hypothetical protein
VQLVGDAGVAQKLGRLGAAGAINAIDGRATRSTSICDFIVGGKTRATNNLGMVWETSVTASAKAVGVTNQSPFLLDLWSRAPRCFGVATYQSGGTSVSGDLGGHRVFGVPMTQMIQSGTFYHSSGDVYEQVPAVGLERAGRFHAYFIEQIDRADEALISSGAGTPYRSALRDCAGSATVISER